MRRWLERLFNPTRTSAAPRREPEASRFQFGDDDSMFPPQTVSDPAAWDEFCRRRFEIAFGPAECHIFAQPAEIAQVLAANNLRSILCVRQWAVARTVGLREGRVHVTVLDLSPYAVQKARESMPAPYDTIRFVTGSLMDANLCSGPYDVILERRTLQLFPPDQLHAAMTAVASRLATRRPLLQPLPHGVGDLLPIRATSRDPCSSSRLAPLRPTGASTGRMHDVGSTG